MRKYAPRVRDPGKPRSSFASDRKRAETFSNGPTIPESADGAARVLPFLDRVQPSFGPHDLSTVRAYTGPGAVRAAEDMGAEAFTIGESVVFGSPSPGLGTVAHEACHVIQQRNRAPGTGPALETVANRVADRVVANSPAMDLLDVPLQADRGPSRRLQLKQRNPFVPPGNRPGPYGTTKAPPIELPQPSRSRAIDALRAPGVPQQTVGGAMCVLGMVNYLVDEAAKRREISRHFGILRESLREEWELANTPLLEDVQDDEYGHPSGVVDMDSLVSGFTLDVLPGAIWEGVTREPKTVRRRFYDIRHLPWIRPDLEREVVLAVSRSPVPDLAADLEVQFALVHQVKEVLRANFTPGSETPVPREYCGMLLSYIPAAFHNMTLPDAPIPMLDQCTE